MKRIASVRPSLLLLIGLAILLRGLEINQRPLWYDEAFTGLYAEKGFKAMLSTTQASDQAAAAEEHPLGYYLLMWGWMETFGNSPGAIRSLSAVAGVATVIIVYFFSRRIFNPRLAKILALLAAISPYQIHYSQEARMYAIMAMFLTLCTWALWEGMQSGAWGWWLVFSVSASLALAAHYLAVFYLISLALTPVYFRRWRAVGALTLASGAAAFLTLPWLVRLPAQFAKIQGAYWTQPPRIDRLITTLLSFITNLPLPTRWLPLGLFISLFLAALAAWMTIKLIRSNSPGWQAGLWLAYLGVCPGLLLFIISQWRPIYIERGLLASGLAFLLWIGWALFTQPRLRFIQATAVLLLIAAAGMGYYQHLTYQGFPYGPFKELDASLRLRIQPMDVVLHSNKISFLPAFYYDPTLPQRFLSDPPGSGSDTLAEPTQRILGIRAYDSLEQATLNAQRVWFLVFDQAIKEYQQSGRATHPQLEALLDHYQLETLEHWGDLRLYGFAIR